MKLTDEQLERAQEKVLGWMFHTSEHVTNTVQLGRDAVGQLSDVLANCREYKSKVEEMQKALDFYGNSDNWELPSFGQGHSAVVSDRGERARQALKGESK